MVVIITELDEDNKTSVYIPKVSEQPTRVVENYWQWQQTPSPQQWGLSPLSADLQQPHPSWTSVTVAGYERQSDQASSGHQWYPGESSHVPRSDEYHRSQQNQGRSGPMPNQQWHYSHPRNGSVPSTSYGAFAEEPQYRQRHNFFQRPQQNVASSSSTSARDTMFGNNEPQQQPFSEFFQGPQRGVNPTTSATARDTMLGNDQDHLGFGHGNMNGTFRPNTTTANTPAGPSSSGPSTSNLPESSRSRPRTSEMPAPGPSTSNMPSHTTVPSTSGNKELLDDLLTSELKPIVKQVIAKLMGKNKQVLNPTPITTVTPEDQGHHALSPDQQEGEKETDKTQKKQRTKAELVGIEHISFTDLPDPIMRSINEFVSNWNGTYQYTLSDRLSGWRVERKQRVTSRYDSYYRHELSGGFFRSVLEIARFILREEYPNRRQSSAREQNVHINQELQVNNGDNDRANLNLDLNTIPCEVEMEDSQINVAKPEPEHNALEQHREMENSTPQLSPSLQQPRGVLKRKFRNADGEAGGNDNNAQEEFKRQKQNSLEETPNDLSSEGTIEDLGFCSSNGVDNSVSLPITDAPAAIVNDDADQPPQETELDSLVSTVARENNSIPRFLTSPLLDNNLAPTQQESDLQVPPKNDHPALPLPTMEVDSAVGAPVGENNSVPLPDPEAPAPISTSAPDLPASSAADAALNSFMQQLPALEVQLPSGVDDMDFAYGADWAFHESSELINHVDTWDSMEDLQNITNMDYGKEPDDSLP
ncbi:hypothetical protein SLEP1_g38858 [Rubroshorea leprosula]|uniref:HSF-type DNA-binding domain-containing protein n=1 Tax=Rubroshorea leprosula TaxID=152421 RepID=A0AAV5KYP9_9ROSI|nr:hypothetical protein SLEP1_g38858 [Rubroshorea leprosula]